MSPQAPLPVTLDEDEFIERFRPLPNQFDPDCGFALEAGGCLFATRGLEFSHVLAQDARTIWTLVEEAGRLFIESGLHYVNRLGYLVTAEPRDGQAAYTVPIDDDFG